MYVGKTSRLLKTLVDEHRVALKYGKSDASAVTEHVWVDEHDVDFQSIPVLVWGSNLHHLS